MKIHLSVHGAIIALLALATSCSNDDIDTKIAGKPSPDKNISTQSSFVAGHEGTRTSLNYTTNDFYWEDGDRIYVKDDKGTFNTSSNTVSGNQVDHFKFMMPGKYTASEYRVYYPGQKGKNNEVSISNNQTQTTPNSTSHIGVSGDCGSGIAQKQANGQYKFTLTHSAVLLCFKPTDSHELTTTYVTKIMVTANSPIAGKYTLSENKGQLTGTDTSKTITLNTKGTGTYTTGFPLKKDGASYSAGRAFMVIAPGKYKFTVKYYVYDTQTKVNAIVTKYTKELEYEPNGYYEIPATLNIRAYDDNYYTWDAKQDYWYGYKSLQPKVNGGNNTNYPKAGDANRWYNTAKHPAKASYKIKDCPNANECMWYCVKGAPQWDNTTPWIAWGHLHTGGMWFKKASVIAKENGKTDAAELKKAAPNKKDYVTKFQFDTPPSNSKIKPGEPIKRSQYFFLPAMGRYQLGTFKEFGDNGRYWTSTPLSYNKDIAYSLYFNSGYVAVSNTIERQNGLRQWTSE